LFDRGPGLERLDLTRCALVGGSSIMVGAGAGEQIDAYDTVIRVNRFPPEDPTVARDFGTKTDVFFINHPLRNSESVDMLRRGRSTPGKISCKEMDNCKTAAIVQRGDNPCDPQEMTRYWGRDHSMTACVRHNVSILAYSFAPLHGFQPSTGFQAFLAFLPLCKELDLFGFGGRATSDGHGEWEGHNLYEEHRIQSTIASREWSKLPWGARMPDGDPWSWMQPRAAKVCWQGPGSDC